MSEQKLEGKLGVILGEYELMMRTEEPRVSITIAKIIALIEPPIKEAKRQERVEIGLQIQQRWSKVTSAKDYSPYKLVDFLGGIITKLNKGQALKEEK